MSNLLAQFPETRRAWRRLKDALRDYGIVRSLKKRGWRREDDWLIMRTSDGHLFAPGSPQNFAYAMRGLFDRKRDSFHFYRAREWHGIMIASRKVFWQPATAAEFKLLFKCGRFDLPPWPEAIECAKIDERMTHLPPIAG